MRVTARWSDGQAKAIKQATGALKRCHVFGKADQATWRDAHPSCHSRDLGALRARTAAFEGMTRSSLNIQYMTATLQAYNVRSVFGSTLQTGRYELRPRPL